MPVPCKHCGTVFEPACAREEFCSAGCAAVHARIAREGLDRFYTLKDRPVAPVGPAALEPRDYAWLEEAVQAAEAGAGPTAELVLDVQGIACVGCVWLIERLFRRRPGAVRLDANIVRGRLFWRWETGRFDAIAFARELQSFGYWVSSAGGESGDREEQSLRLRMGLCGAFAMNTMLFVLPSYLGLERSSEYFPVFEAIAAAFATAALVAAGGFFAKRAFAAVRAGTMNLDVPIVLGLLVGYAGSLVGWLGRHSELVYFDFVAVFSFLMLVGRWTQEAAVARNRRQLLALSRDPTDVQVESGRSDPLDGADKSDESDLPARAGLVRRAAAALRRGEVFRVRSGQVVPVAARLRSGAATFTTEWINGEPEPIDLRGGQLVPAGATNVSLAEIRLEAAEDWRDSALARLLAASGAGGFRHERAERIIRVYLLVVVGLAGLGGIGWGWIGGDPLKALHVAIAVLVASCPCGIGVAFPLIEELAVAAMRRHGVFVRELSLFPRLRCIHKIVFDKTGTLTLATPVLQNPEALATLAPPAGARLWALVRDNPHPTARAVHEALAAIPDAVPSSVAPGGTESAIEEVVGHGVRLRGADGGWALGRPGFGGANTDRSDEADPSDASDRPAAHTPADAEFTHDGRVLARFRFAEAARSDARRELVALQAEGRAVFILSGDRAAKVAVLASALGVPAAHAFGGLSPEAKRDWLAAHDARDTLMLGDGANDSLAFDAAFARGTPVIHRGVLERKSDFHYLGRGLRGLRRLFAVAEVRRRTVRYVFVFTVLYNVGMVTFALAGRVNPLVAAVAMPASSLLSLALATGGMRRAFRA